VDGSVGYENNTSRVVNNVGNFFLHGAKMSFSDNFVGS
jgi:hypothetical protein